MFGDDGSETTRKEYKSFRRDRGNIFREYGSKTIGKGFRSSITDGGYS
jgi:hypothetical protein